MPHQLVLLAVVLWCVAHRGASSSSDSADAAEAAAAAARPRAAAQHYHYVLAEMPVRTDGFGGHVLRALPALEITLALGLRPVCNPNLFYNGHMAETDPYDVSTRGRHRVRKKSYSLVVATNNPS
jgi:hypothetical protein